MLDGTRCSAHSALGLSRAVSGVRNDQNGTSGWTGCVGNTIEGESLVGGIGRCEMAAAAEAGGVGGAGWEGTALGGAEADFLVGLSKKPLRMVERGRGWG